MFTGPAGRGVFEGLLRPPRLRDPLLGSPQRALSSYLFVAAVTACFYCQKSLVYMEKFSWVLQMLV